MPEEKKEEGFFEIFFKLNSSMSRMMGMYGPNYSEGLELGYVILGVMVVVAIIATYIRYPNLFQ